MGSGYHGGFGLTNGFQMAKKIKIQFKSEKEIEDYIDKNY